MPARKGEQAADQRGGAVGGRADAVQLGPHLGLASQPEGEKLGRPHDAGEEVVELVRNPARQPADRFHLLRVQELILEPPALPHVVHHAQRADEIALVVVQGAGRDQGPDRVTGLVLESKRVHVGEALPVTFDHAVGFGPHVLVHELPRRTTQHSLHGPPEHGRHLRIDERRAPLRVQQPDAVAGSLHDAAVGLQIGPHRTAGLLRDPGADGRRGAHADEEKSSHPHSPVAGSRAPRRAACPRRSWLPRAAPRSGARMARRPGCPGCGPAWRGIGPSPGSTAPVRSGRRAPAPPVC